MQRLRILAGLAVAALAVRAIAIWSTGVSVHWFGDAEGYVEAAALLCSEGRYPWTGDLPFFRAPGLPLWIALVTGCRPERIVWAKGAVAFLDAGSVVLAYAIARALGMVGGAALLGAGLVAVHPLLVRASTDVTSEPLATFFVSGWLAAVLWGTRSEGRVHAVLWLAAGAAAALAALTRPAALVCVPLGLAGAALLDGARFSRFALRAAFLTGAAALVLAPWAVVASRAAGGLVIVSDGAGYNLWRGMHPDLARATASRDVETFLRESLRFETETSPRVAAEVSARAATLAERSAEWRRLALVDLRSDPLGAAAFLARKTRVYWRPWPDRSVSPRWFVLAGAALLVPLLAAGVLGLGRIARQRPREASFLALCLVVPWLVQLPFQVAIRFRLPFSEVLLCVLAAGLVWPAALRLRSGRRSDA